MYNYIKTEKKGFQYILTLARSEKRNAFSPTMVNEINHAFQQANADNDIKVVLIKAEGPVFCAGMDLKTFKNPELDIPNPNIENKNISLGEVFDSLHKPTIAMVEGNVIAGGFLIILGCTYVFCKSEVQFRLPELELGIFPFQVMASLLKVVPEKKALQICLNTDYFDVNQAIQLGIVDAVWHTDDIEKRISSFENISIKALSSGIKATRQIQNITPQERFQYLKNQLEKLRE